MRRASWFALILTAICFSAEVSANPYYYNKIGVNRELFASDMSECMSLAKPAKARDIYAPYQPNIYVNAFSSFLAGWMKGSETRRIKRSIERTCMADKGYIRFEANDQMSNDMRALERDARTSKLYDYASSSNPLGKRLPE